MRLRSPGPRLRYHRNMQRSPSLMVLFAATLICGLVLLAIPRAVEPSDLPVLTLSADEARQVEVEDARRAAKAPQTTNAQQLRQLYLSFGESEAVAIETPTLLRQRRSTLHHLFELVAKESGSDAAQALRSEAVEQLEAALNARPVAHVQGILGVFPNVLEHFQAARDGLEVAPHFVVRTLYKARWNRMFDLPVSDGFAAAEKRAYFGWLGLHADSQPLEERRRALSEYAAAGGLQAAEAQGVLAFMASDYPHAVEQLARAYEETPSLRLRNYLRGARVAADHARPRGDATANATSPKAQP
jgi:hypothetical protein